jgi:hypothetical protein
MVKDELRAEVVYLGRDEIAALLHGPAEGRGKEVENIRARRGGDGADGLVAFKSERTCGIAECGAG